MTEYARLPKQARHWVEKAGFKLYYTRGWRQMIYAKSRKPIYLEGCRDPVRHIRLNPERGVLQICDGYFDRWANSVAATVDLGLTEAAFNASLKAVVKKARWKLCKEAA